MTDSPWGILWPHSSEFKLLPCVHAQGDKALGLSIIHVTIRNYQISNIQASRKSVPFAQILESCEKLSLARATNTKIILLLLVMPIDHSERKTMC